MRRERGEKEGDMRNRALGRRRNEKGGSEASEGRLVVTRKESNNTQQERQNGCNELRKGRNLRRGSDRRARFMRTEQEKRI